MDTQNLILNEVFNRNAKEYQTRPVMAAKYVPGMENGYMVYFSNKADGKRNPMQYEGVRFFATEHEAFRYIHSDQKQYIMENGQKIEVAVEYDSPKPVIHKEKDDSGKPEGIVFNFGDKAFLSDESEDYEFYILEENCWIIQEPDNGTIRAWYPELELEETFFGKNYICEKIYNGNCCSYVQVVV